MSLQTTSQDKGITILKNKNGFAVFKLHYSADEDKSQEWAEKLKASYPSADIWSQEMELDFTKSTGLRLYPDFKEVVHVKDKLTPIPYKHIFRFWDFGYRHPACLFAQINNEDQLVVLNEMFGSDIVIHEFGKSVKRFTKANYPGWEVEDFCDPAGKFKSDKMQKTTIDILHTLDIYPRHKNSAVQEGITQIRALILTREDGSPGLLIDRNCKILIDGFLGGYVRDEVTDEPVKDGFYEHSMDALRYGVVNLFSNKNFLPTQPSYAFTKKRKTASLSTGY